MHIVVIEALTMCMRHQHGGDRTAMTGATGGQYG